MNTLSPESDLAEPAIRELLCLLGIDVEYVRGEGNILYFLDEAGREVAVVDYAGGYGALILGHNNPDLVATAISFLQAGIPTLAQVSRQPLASRIATKLNEIIQREFGSSEPYFAVFSNSGAESIEVGLKHAEFDRGLKIQALRAKIDAHIEKARAAVRAGSAVLPQDAPGDIETLISRLQRTNAEITARPPVFFALEGSFHGKLVGSIQLTHNESYRAPFASMAMQAQFIPFDQPEAVTKIIETERAVLLDLQVENGEITVVERDFPIFAAFVLEVIQGEGGIRTVTREQAREIQRACAAVGCPILVDEIQSGMGRTGAFFASSLIGLQADYFALAKGLGGGIAKTAVTLIRGSRFRKEFNPIHTSTFAKDTFSSAITLKVLEILEADDGKAYRHAREWGDRLMTLFRSLLDEYPDVVKEARGKGLMLGLEFHDQSTAAAPGIRQAAQSNTLGYVFSGYLLRAHRIRTFPTASAVNTLRFEPSLYLTDGEINLLDSALRSLCSVLRDQDEQTLFSPTPHR